jgi:hypothetical protein
VTDEIVREFMTPRQLQLDWARFNIERWKLKRRKKVYWSVITPAPFSSSNAVAFSVRCPIRSSVVIVNVLTKNQRLFLSFRLFVTACFSVGR